MSDTKFCNLVLTRRVRTKSETELAKLTVEKRHPVKLSFPQVMIMKMYNL